MYDFSSRTDSFTFIFQLPSNILVTKQYRVRAKTDTVIVARNHLCGTRLTMIIPLFRVGTVYYYYYKPVYAAAARPRDLNWQLRAYTAVRFLFFNVYFIIFYRYVFDKTKRGKGEGNIVLYASIVLLHVYCVVCFFKYYKCRFILVIIHSRFRGTSCTVCTYRVFRVRNRNV